MKKIIYAVFLAAFTTSQAFAACDPRSAAKVQRSDGYLKVCSGGTLEINSGATFTNASPLSISSSVSANYVDSVGAVDGTAFYSFVSTMAAALSSNAEITNLLGRVRWYKGDNSNAILNGIEGVCSSHGADESITCRGGHFRTYTPTGATIRTSIGADISARAGIPGAADIVAESGTAFVGARVWMAPGFTVGSIGNVNNFHGLWIYNEHATNTVTNGIKIESAGGGFTNDLTLQSGDTVKNSAAGPVVFSGLVEAASFTGDLTGNADTATNATNHIAEDATDEVHGSTSANVNSTIVARDGSGNFSAGTITAALIGNASTATNATNHIAEDATDEVHGSTSANVASSIVARDGSGNFTAGTITAALIGNASTATNATNHIVEDATDEVHGSTSANVASSIVARDGSGDFTAGTITAALTGNASTASALAAAGSKAASGYLTMGVDASGNSIDSEVDAAAVSGSTNAVQSAALYSHAALGGADEVHGSTATNVVSTIVARDGSGNFAAGTITANLSGNATTATNATDHIAEGASTEVHGSTATNVVSTIVARDGSGDFAAGTITASLTGAASLNALKSGDTFTGKVGLAVKTISELEAITPAAKGEVYFCSDTSPARIAVSTGTAAGDFSDALGLTLY